MKPCKCHQRQIALLAVEALAETERAAVVQHLQECPGCRLYAEQLQGVVGLYAQDAERTVAAPSTARQGCLALPESIPWYQKLFASRAPALAAAAVLIICAAALLTNRMRNQDISPAVRPVATVTPKSPMVLSIGNSRHLTFAELEDLSTPKAFQSSNRTEFVFSVKTRDDGS